MFLFPGQKVPAVTKYFQRELGAILNCNFSLSNVRQLIAAMAGLNSDAHLAQVLKEGSPIDLIGATGGFLELLADRHKIKPDETQLQLIDQLIRHTPIEMMPVPDFKDAMSSSVYGQEQPLSEAIENTWTITDRVRRALDPAPIDIPPEMLSLLREWDAEGGPIKDNKATVDAILKDLFNSTPLEEGSDFENWVERHGMREKVKANIQGFLSMHENAMELSVNRFVVWSFHAYRVGDLSAEQRDHFPGELLTSPDSVIGEWHCAMPDDEDGEGFNDLLNVNERAVFVGVYQKGQWVYLGAGMGVTISAESEYDLLDKGDQYAPDTNVLAKAVLLGGTGPSRKEVVDAVGKRWGEAQKRGRPFVATMPNCEMIAPLWSDHADNLAAFLLSRVPAAPPCLFIRSLSSRPGITPRDCAAFQCMPAYYPSDAILVPVYGARPVSSQVDRRFVRSLNFPEQQREPLDGEDVRRIEHQQAIADAVFKQLPGGGAINIQFDPFTFPPT